MSRRLLATALIVAALPTALPILARAQPADTAVARVGHYGAAVSRVAASGGTVQVRAGKFLPVVREAYDLTGALALIAGPGWASATPEARAAASDAFARMSAARHADSFHGAGLAFAVDPASKPRGADQLVRAKVGDETLVYRMRESAGQWRILDVTARGVSQLAIQRADFASTVAAGGVAGLTRKLNELAAR